MVVSIFCAAFRGVAGAVVIALFALTLSACGGGGGGGGGSGSASSTPTTYTISVSVSGLLGSGLQLQLNGGNTLNVAANGNVTFPGSLANGSSYAVSVRTQPSSPSQTCTVANGSGSVAGGNVTNIAITCAINTYTVAGTASGLAGSGLQLQLNGGNNLNVSANGGFVFSAPIADGSSYNVTVRAQPSSPSQTCSVLNGAGTVNAANITNVQVSCTTNSYLVGGTVTGLTGDSVVLQLNGGNNLTVTSANRNFTFPIAIASGGLYSVSVLAHPTSPSQTCAVTNGSGTIGGANVDNVIVSCVTNPPSSSSYSIGGTVNGLSGSGLQLQLNGSNTLSITGGGSFTFPAAAKVSDGSSYNVTVLTNPSSPAQTCTVSSGVGTVAGADVTSVVVTCATTAYTIRGNVSGLSGSGLRLQLNGAEDLSVTLPGFAFTTPVADGSPYSVTVRTQPSSPSQTCAVTNGTGTASGDVSNVQVNCNTDSFPVSVTVNGLSGGTLTLRNNGADDLAITSNGSFMFASSVASGAPYAVTVASSPTSPTQTCTVARSSGVVGNSAVTDVVVNCAINTYTVGGTVTGLSGTGLVLGLNGGNALGVSSSGAFTFTDRIADGSAYTVTVATQPSSQTCMVTNGTGTLAGAIVTNVTVTCSTVKWSGIKQFGSAADDVANAVAVDPSNGDVVVVGCYQGALSGNVKGTCDMPGGNARAYVRKYDRTGDFKWEGSLGNSGNTQANAVAIDIGGNIYVTGVSQGAFDGQLGHNDDDYFLTKYDSNGNKLWTGVYGGAGADRGNALAFDGSGNLYLAGITYGTSYDIFVAKFPAADLSSLTTPPGSPVQTATFGSIQTTTQPNDFAFHVAIDSAGFVYVSGTTLGRLGSNTSAGDADTFVMKLDATANPATFTEVWTNQIGTSSYDRNGGLAVDGDGNVYVAGSTGLCLPDPSNCPKTPGVNDMFVVKYDASGAQQWIRQVISPGHDYVTSMAAGPGRSLYITGYTTGSFSGNKNADRSGNTTDIFLVKYAGDGTKLWSRQLGTTTDDRPYAVTADRDPFDSTADAGAFVVGYTLGALGGNTNVGGADMFITKYDANGVRQ